MLIFKDFWHFVFKENDRFRHKNGQFSAQKSPESKSFKIILCPAAGKVLISVQPLKQELNKDYANVNA